VLPFAAIDGLIMGLLLRKDLPGPRAAARLMRLPCVRECRSRGAVHGRGDALHPAIASRSGAPEHTGKPMDQKWLETVFRPADRHALAAGCRRITRRSTRCEALLATPLGVGFGLISLTGLLVGGVVVCFRARPEHATLWLLVIASAAAGVSVFKWVMGIEWIFWYSFFTLLPLRRSSPALRLDAWLFQWMKPWRIAVRPAQKALAVQSWRSGCWCRWRPSACPHRSAI